MTTSQDRSSRGSSSGQSLVELTSRFFLGGLAFVPTLIVLALVGLMGYECFLFFNEVSFGDFLTATEWTPQFEENRNFGIQVLLVSTLIVSGIALLIAVPIGIVIGIYLAEYAPSRLRVVVKPVIESLTGIPTIVLGYFAYLTISPVLADRVLPQVRNLIGLFNQEFADSLSLAPFNGLCAGLVIGLISVPVVSSLVENGIRNIPDRLREGSAALGMTKFETLLHVLLPAALPAIVGAVILVTSRIFGETMIAAVAGGAETVLRFNPLESMSTMSAYILNASLATPSLDSIEFRSIFAVGAVLFLTTLVLNTAGNITEAIYRQQVIADQVAKVRVADNPYVALPDIRSLIVAGQQDGFRQSSAVRRSLDWVFQGISLISVFLVAAFLVWMLGDAFLKGYQQLSWAFLTSLPASARDSEQLGIAAPIVGSLWLMAVAFAFAVPVGVGAGMFLEEYLPRLRYGWARKVNAGIEILMANLAAVPSIVYGLLGVELFVRLLAGVTQGRTILSGGLTLAVVILPLLIIATRSALRDVPNSLRRAGYAVGMSSWQVIFFVTLPAAFPSIFSGIILALSTALGETSALVAIGAKAFVSFLPENVLQEFMALPVQIYFWATSPDPVTQKNGAATIVVLAGILLFLNVVALLLRSGRSKLSRL
ncbi:MAG: phosphate ABC transporter permease subunit PstC [Oscillatoriales cyanobacterium SM2_2_1]|nr:phosphate ABC transporter permease subunit PstC [Oscillatoriales cyanobacterium SM2_2_1]